MTFNPPVPQESLWPYGMVPLECPVPDCGCRQMHMESIRVEHAGVTVMFAEHGALIRAPGDAPTTPDLDVAVSVFSWCEDGHKIMALWGVKDRRLIATVNHVGNFDLAGPRPFDMGVTPPWLSK
jgi:hypothetical protein